MQSTRLLACLRAENASLVECAYNLECKVETLKLAIRETIESKNEKLLKAGEFVLVTGK